MSAMREAGGGRGPLPGDPVYKFTPKNLWQFHLSMLAAAALPGWLTVLQRHWRDIHWRFCWHRIMYISFKSCVNSLWSAVEFLCFRCQISKQSLHPEPIFILGAYRSGTTHLHNLLAQDPAFAYVTAYNAGFPHCFVSAPWLKRLFQPLLPKHRPMDRMTLDFDMPSEDEMAVLAMSGGRSPCMGFLLPSKSAQLTDAFLNFETANGAHASDLQAWESSFLLLLRKVTFMAAQSDARLGNANVGPRPLVIKSPVHTGRIRLLLKHFPKSRFVYIHRNPYEVFQSFAHMVDTFGWGVRLEPASDKVLTEFVFHHIGALLTEYSKQKAIIPSSKLVEVSFDKLESDPLGTLESMYQSFGWTEQFKAARPAIEAYTDTQIGYKKAWPPGGRACKQPTGSRHLPYYHAALLMHLPQNNYIRLDAAMKAAVRRRWADAFEAHGYET